MKMEIEVLESRDTPSSVISSSGIVRLSEVQENTVGYSFQPFGGYDGILDTEHVHQELIVVGAGNFGGPRFAVFEPQKGDGFYTYRKAFDTFAFEPSFRGGVSVALTDYDHDGDFDVLVGAGIGGAPRVQFWTNNGQNSFVKTQDYFAFESTFRDGVNVDGWFDSWAILPTSNGGPRINIDGRTSFFGDSSARGAIWLYGDVDYDNVPEIVSYNSGFVQIFDKSGTLKSTSNIHEQYTEIGVGGLFNNHYANGFVASKPSVIDEIDLTLEFILQYDVGGKNVQIGHSQIIHFQTPNTQQEPEATLLIDGGEPVSSIFTGTYTGTFVDKITNEKLGLTNKHVVQNKNFDAESPTVYDKTKIPIGITIRQSDIKFDGTANKVDAAVFRLYNEPEEGNHVLIRTYDPYLEEYRERRLPIKGVAVAKPNEIVYKTGRTTETTKGYVVSDDQAVAIKYPVATAYFHEQYSIRGISPFFSRPGDSGSPVFVVRNNEAFLTAQVFAGSSNRTIASKIQDVLDHMGIRLDTTVP